jgi:AbrB family looped-hinge helix DNA binding protein
MNVVKLGKKGQVSIPKAVLDRLGVESEQMLLVDTTDDGAIVLRPAGVYPIEIYSDERVAEFLAEDELPIDLQKRVADRLEDTRIR